MSYDAANTLPDIGGTNTFDGVVPGHTEVGAVTQIIVDMSHDKATATVAAFWALKPGNNELDSKISAVAGVTDIKGSSFTTMSRTTFGVINSCSGFGTAGNALPAATTINVLMCVGENLGAGRIFSIATGALGVADTTTYLGTDMSTLVVPSGGIANFKGATSTGAYVVQKCFSIAPMYPTGYL